MPEQMPVELASPSLEQSPASRRPYDPSGQLTPILRGLISAVGEGTEQERKRKEEEEKAQDARLLHSIESHPDPSVRADSMMQVMKKHKVKPEVQNMLLKTLGTIGKVIAGGAMGAATLGAYPQLQERRREEEFGRQTDLERMREQERLIGERETARERERQSWETSQAKIDFDVRRQKALTDAANQQEWMELQKQFVRIDNRARDLTTKYRLKPEEALHQAEFDITGKQFRPEAPQKGQIRVAPDDPSKPEGTYHYEEFNPDGTAVNRGPAPRPASAKPPLEPASVRSALWVQSHLNDPDPQVRAAAKQMNDRANAAIQNAANQRIDDETLKYLAEKSLIMGQDPTFGLGNAAAGNRVQFYRMQRQTAMESGNTIADVAAKQSLIRALRQSEPRIQTLKALTTVNESNALKTFDYLEKTLGPRMDKESYQTAVPLINEWLRTGQVRLGDNAAVNDFLSNLTLGATEFAKVATGQTSGAAVTDRARAEVQGLVGKGLSTKTISDWIDNVARPDMQFRRDSYSDEIKNYEEGIRETGLQIIGKKSTQNQSPARDLKNKSTDELFQMLVTPVGTPK